jgi:hypothetical protein
MHRQIRRLLILAPITCIAAMLAGATASANGGGSLVTALIGGNCGATSTPFSQWGDQSAYYFAQNGGFEQGAAGWTLSGGAAVVSGNEPYHVHASSDAYSLNIPDGASATSPSLCFGLLTPNVRFFAVSTGNGPATIHVRIIARGLLGVLSVIDGGTTTVGTSWAPTQAFATLGSQLNSLVGAKSIQVQITTTGSVKIDDIYIDPFCSK